MFEGIAAPLLPVYFYYGTLFYGLTMAMARLRGWFLGVPPGFLFVASFPVSLVPAALMEALSFLSRPGLFEPGFLLPTL